MILFDLHVCVKGIAHPDKCQEYYWLNEMQLKGMVNCSETEFKKEHDAIKGGKYDGEDASYSWKARLDEDAPMSKIARGEYLKSPHKKAIALRGPHFICASCEHEDYGQSGYSGACAKCGYSGETRDTPENEPARDQDGNFNTADTADSAPGHGEQAGHEGCDPSKPCERGYSGESENPKAEEKRKQMERAESASHHDLAHAEEVKAIEKGSPTYKPKKEMSGYASKKETKKNDLEPECPKEQYPTNPPVSENAKDALKAESVLKKSATMEDVLLWALSKGDALSHADLVSAMDAAGYSMGNDWGFESSGDYMMTMRRTLRQMDEKGLLTRPEHGLYAITEAGKEKLLEVAPFPQPKEPAKPKDPTPEELQTWYKSRPGQTQAGQTKRAGALDQETLDRILGNMQTIDDFVDALYNGNIEDFLQDNPGANEVLMDWIRDTWTLHLFSSGQQNDLLNWANDNGMLDEDDESSSEETKGEEKSDSQTKTAADTSRWPGEPLQEGDRVRIRDNSGLGHSAGDLGNVVTVFDNGAIRVQFDDPNKWQSPSGGWKMTEFDKVASLNTIADKPTKYKELEIRPREVSREDVERAAPPSAEMKNKYAILKGAQNNLESLRRQLMDLQANFEKAKTQSEKEGKRLESEQVFRQSIEDLAMLITESQNRVVTFGDRVVALVRETKKVPAKANAEWKLQKLLEHYGADAEKLLKRAEAGLQSQASEQTLQQLIEFELKEHAAHPQAHAPNKTESKLGKNDRLQKKAGEMGFLEEPFKDIKFLLYKTIAAMKELSLIEEEYGIAYSGKTPEPA